MQKIHFFSKGQRIDGTLITPHKMKSQNSGIIFFHGMTSSEERYIPIVERLAEQGIVGMTLNIRGHGTSEGDFNTLTVNDAVLDGLSAYDFLTKHDFIDPKKITLCGASVGAAIAAMVSTKKTVDKLILRVPATYTPEMMKMTFQQIMAEEGNIFKKINNISETPPVKALSQFKGDLLIITSENDLVIPSNIPKHYLSAARLSRSKELIEIQGAEHNITGEKREEFITDLVKWMSN